MESTFRKQIVKSDKLKEVMKMYKWDINQTGSTPSYEVLRRMVDTFIETSRLERASREYDHKSKKYRSLVRSAPGEEKECRHWTAKGACHRGDACAFWHDPGKKAKPRNPSRGTPGTPKGGKGKGTDGRSPSKGRKGKGKGKRDPSGYIGSSKSRSSNGSRGSGGGKGKSKAARTRPNKTAAKGRGTSPSGKKDRMPCKYYQEGSCNKGKECDFYHPKLCQYHKKGKCKKG